ncbi:MAG: hypothetical protein HOJ89_08505, partial [Opitutales bacterium]|nr:hypothetical protein [Opitutales bacterium]
SNFDRGEVLVPMFQRILKLGARRLGQETMIACGELSAVDRSQSWIPLGADGTRDIRLHAGIYQAGERIVAVNRPDAEDDHSVITPEVAAQLFGELPLQLSEQTNVEESALQGEVWRLFVIGMLAFLIIAEVGYMVGGVWLADETGMIGAIYHVIADAFMTLCVFLFAGILFAKTGKRDLSAMDGQFKKMPLTLVGFLVGAFSLIGIPPTAGFFSKWYLIQGGINSGHYEYVIALLISSLINAVLFFRMIEIAYFGVKPAEGHDHHQSDDHDTGRSEASASMLIPLLVTAALLLLIGIFNKDIVVIITDFVSPFNIASGAR